MKKMLLKFADNLLSKEQMKGIKGGYVCPCNQAAPYACTAQGYQTGGQLWDACVKDIYVGCRTYSPGSGC